MYSSDDVEGVVAELETETVAVGEWIPNSAVDTQEKTRAS